MTDHSATPETTGKRVGFLELFFDLVFVFAVTQLVALLHHDHDLAGWGRAGLMLWLIWWAWSQFAWVGNALSIDDGPARPVVLAATGAMLAAGVAIPTAYGDDAVWFAVPYAAVRLAGLALYWIGLADDRDHRAALATYLPMALIGPVLVLSGGLVGGGAQVALWLVALVVDLASVLAAGRGAFQVDPAHFAERHGLIVIIALGESVVAGGATAADTGLDAAVAGVLAAAVALAAALWWCYFDWVHAAAEARLHGEADHTRRSNLARDLFTLGHLPIVAGTILVAVAVEEALLHPTEGLEPFAVAALAVGPGLFLVGFVLGNLRATGRVLRTRLVGLVVAAGAAIAVGGAADPVLALGAVALVLAAVAALEARGLR